MTWRTVPPEVPAEFLPACLLLLLAEGPAHGYRLCELLAELGMAVDSGTVYRRLREMERDGVVTSHWELSETGPPRRQYMATPEGLTRLDDCQASIRSVVNHLLAYSQRCARVVENRSPDPSST